LISVDKEDRVVAPSVLERVRRRIGRTMDGRSLKARVFRGGAWLGTGTTTEQALRFARNMILTRLLAPEAFGTMAVILSATSVIQSFTDIGVREALIQNPRGAERRYIGTAWWMAFSRALGLYAVIALAAPWVASFYGNPQITSLLRVAVLSILFEGAFSPRAYILLKEMKFRKWAVVNHGGGICGILITVVLSFLIRDVWALVIGACIESAGRCLLSYAICPFLPPPKWDKESLRDLLKYSRGVVGLSFLNFLFLRSDIFVLAKLYSATQLGLYSMGIALAQTPTMFLLSLEAQILMPAFSQIQNQTQRINEIVLRVTALIALLGMPLLTFVFFRGESLLTLIYGRRYAAAAAPLVFASGAALLNLGNGLITTVFCASGRPALHRRAVGAMAVMMVVLVYPLSKWLGPPGAQVASAISIAVGYFLQIHLLWKLTGLELSRFAKSIVSSILISATTAVVCFVTAPFAHAARPVAGILLGLVGCLVAYSIMLLIQFRTSRRLV
jgi:O-antigen/teichoic acid export membrane protein